MKLLIAILTTGAMLISSHVHADGERYQTSWTFRSTNWVTGVYTSYGDMQANQVVMPLGSQWLCHKVAVSDRADGKRVGSFYCTSGSVIISVQAECMTIGPDFDMAYAAIGNNRSPSDQRVVAFTVTCRTSKINSGI